MSRVYRHIAKGGRLLGLRVPGEASAWAVVTLGALSIQESLGIAAAVSTTTWTVLLLALRGRPARWLVHQAGRLIRAYRHGGVLSAACRLSPPRHPAERRISPLPPELVARLEHLAREADGVRGPHSPAARP